MKQIRVLIWSSQSSEEQEFVSFWLRLQQDDYTLYRSQADKINLSEKSEAVYSHFDCEKFMRQKNKNENKQEHKVVWTDAGKMWRDEFEVVISEEKYQRPFGFSGVKRLTFAEAIKHFSADDDGS